jgi:hypothetical protein
LNREQTIEAFRQAGWRAENDAPDGFFERTGIHELAFFAEVSAYCKGEDAAGTIGDIVVGYHLAKILDALDGGQELEKCPGCNLMLPQDDLRLQVAHVEQAHPEIIAERLELAGFVRQPDGSWLDVLADPNGR